MSDTPGTEDPPENDGVYTMWLGYDDGEEIAISADTTAFSHALGKHRDAPNPLCRKCQSGA